MKKLKKILAVTLALIMACAMLIPALAADTGSSDVLVPMDVKEPIPLLIIKINFDADGNGLDRYDDLSVDWGDEKKSDKAVFGEQWCYSDDDWWVEQLFSDNKYSLKSYYKFLSNGKFYFYPAEETYSPEIYKNEPNNGAYDGVNDGIVTVTIDYAHPYAATKSGTTDGAERVLAIQAASEYVDFAKYDKNGNGNIEYSELSVVFVYAGAELTRYSGNLAIRYAFGTHAHVLTLGDTANADGVTVLKMQPYVRVGEAMSGGKFLTYGTFAHELGHVLGAGDLYNVSGTYVGSPGSLSLMGNGSSGTAPGKSSGTSPAILDPYYSLKWGFCEGVVADVGTNEYTLYSRETGKYNVVKVPTADPQEYYLIENRSHTDASYDQNGDNNKIQGILIWHVHQGIMESTMRPNDGPSHDAGLTVLTPGGNYQAVGADSTFTKDTARFDCHNYTFPVSGTWYTRMDAAEAAGTNIRIEVLDDAGEEMRVRVISSVERLPEYEADVVTAYAEEGTSATVNITITDYHGKAIDSMKIILSEKDDMTDSVEGTVTANGNTYTATFEGLKVNTRYFYKIVMNTDKGELSANEYFYSAKKPVEVTYYTLTIYKNQRDGEKPVTQRVNFGEKFTYSFPMTKSGYVLMGWYLDEACTEKFDMDFTQDEAVDFSIYAKWVPADEAATLKVNGATVENKVFSVNVGETFTVPVAKEKTGYTFGGWYADEAFTTEFDFTAPVSANGTINVYAKWLNENGEVDTTAAPVTTAPTTEAPTEPGASGEPTEPGKESSPVLIAIIIVVALVVGGGVIAAVVVMTKKKNK